MNPEPNSADQVSDTSDTGPFSPLIEHAVELSSQWHDQTYRKSRWRREAFEVPPGSYLGVPVFAHVTAVALTVQRSGWDDATVAAAFLHDVIEDGNQWGDRLPYDRLVNLIRPDVADLVREVSEDKRDTSGESLPWKTRKDGYIDRLREASDGAVAISLADKLHNLWTINAGLRKGIDVFSSDDNRRALSADPQQQLWFFREVYKIAGERNDPRFAPLRDRLLEEITRFEELTAPGDGPSQNAS